MTVTLSTRLGMTRWSSDTDAWSREQIDANFGQLEANAIIGTQGANAARPAAGVQRRLYLATDAERVYIDDGDEWYELLVAGVANATAVVFTPTGGIAATTVAAALAELDTEKATTAALSAHTGAAAGAHAATAISYAGSTNLSATTVEAALNELDAEKLGTGHTTAAGAHTAANITNVPAGTISATTVQAAIAELDGDVTAHTGASAGAHAATAISNTPAGGVAATTVQAAINELDTEKAPKASPVFTGAPAGTPAAATDLPTAITLVNYLRDRLLAVGLTA